MKKSTKIDSKIHPWKIDHRVDLFTLHLPIKYNIWYFLMYLIIYHYYYNYYFFVTDIQMYFRSYANHLAIDLQTLVMFLKIAGTWFLFIAQVCPAQFETENWIWTDIGALLHLCQWWTVCNHSYWRKALYQSTLLCSGWLPKWSQPETVEAYDYSMYKVY